MPSINISNKRTALMLSCQLHRTLMKYPAKQLLAKLRRKQHSPESLHLTSVLSLLDSTVPLVTVLLSLKMSHGYQHGTDGNYDHIYGGISKVAHQWCKSYSKLSLVVPWIPSNIFQQLASIMYISSLNICLKSIVCCVAVSGKASMCPSHYFSQSTALSHFTRELSWAVLSWLQRHILHTLLYFQDGKMLASGSKWMISKFAYFWISNLITSLKGSCYITFSRYVLHIASNISECTKILSQTAISKDITLHVSANNRAMVRKHLAFFSLNLLMYDFAAALPEIWFQARGIYCKFLWQVSSCREFIQ